MAIAFARVEIVSTKLGGSAVGLSAYLNRDRMCTRIATGRQFDFTAKAQDMSGEYVRSELLLSANVRVKNGPQARSALERGGTSGPEKGRHHKEERTVGQAYGFGPSCRPRTDAGTAN